MISTVRELYNVVNSAYRFVESDPAFSKFCVQAKPFLSLSNESAIGPLISLAEKLPEAFSRGVRLNSNVSATMRFHENELITDISALIARWSVQPRLRNHLEQLGLQARSLLDRLYQWRQMLHADHVIAESYRLTDGLYNRALQLAKEPLISFRELNTFIDELHDYIEHMRPEADRFALPGWPRFAASVDELEAFVLINETEL